MKNVKSSNNFRILAISALLFVFYSQAVLSYYYQIEEKCIDGICIEGQEAAWEVTIYNDGKHNVEFTKIEMLDSKNNSVFASLSIPYFPQSDNRGDLIKVEIGGRTKVNVTGKVPAANSGKSEIYYPCFTIAIYDFYTIARDDNYESRQCFAKNESMDVYECKVDSHCRSAQYCSVDKCVDLKCESCQYVFDHSCADFECCSPDQCQFDQSCQNNTCVNLGCQYNQYILNNSCFDLECGFDEQIINNSCLKLECGFDEFAFNHSCAKLECREDEFILNHTCQPLNCHEDEYAKDHLCIILECAKDEAISNHSCIKLDCWFFQDIAEHQCINNNSVITKLSLEIIAMVVLISFLILDFGRFRSTNPKKNQKGQKASLKLDSKNQEQKIAGKESSEGSKSKKDDEKYEEKPGDQLPGPKESDSGDKKEDDRGQEKSNQAKKESNKDAENKKK